MSYATSLPNGLRLPQQRVPTPPPPTQRPVVEAHVAESFEARASDALPQTPMRQARRASPPSGAGPLPTSLNSAERPTSQEAVRVLFPERVQPSQMEPAGFSTSAGFSAPRPMGGTYDKGDFSDPPAFPGFQHYRLFNADGMN